jgi:hypothetical protein
MVAGRFARLFAALVAVVLGAAACSHAPERYAGAGEVVSAMQSESVACSHRRPVTPARLIKDGTTCSIGGERVAIYTFQTATDRNHWVDVGRLYGPFVEGPDWVVATRTAATADRVAGALGGTVHHPPR